MSWAQKQRQSAIWEFLAIGSVNRSDLCDRFGITFQTASGDLARFNAQNPDVMKYDRLIGSYVPDVGYHKRRLEKKDSSPTEDSREYWRARAMKVEAENKRLRMTEASLRHTLSKVRDAFR